MRERDDEDAPVRAAYVRVGNMMEPCRWELDTRGE